MSVPQPAVTPNPGVMQPVWTPDDSALAYTCRVVGSVMANGWEGMDFTEVQVPFAPVISSDEVYIARGPYVWSRFMAIGDGSYVADQSSTLAFGSRGALAFTAASEGLRMLSNSMMADAAAKNAEVKWREVSRGQMVVGDQGFYMMADSQQTLPWDWSSISEMRLLGRSLVEYHGLMEGDIPVQFMVQSPYAELIFALWASARHPRHPMLRRGGWLPQGWLDWAYSQGRVTTDAANAIATFDPHPARPHPPTTPALGS